MFAHSAFASVLHSNLFSCTPAIYPMLRCILLFELIDIDCVVRQQQRFPLLCMHVTVSCDVLTIFTIYFSSIQQHTLLSVQCSFLRRSNFAYILCLSDPVSLVRDHKLKQELVQAGISVTTFNADLLYEPWEINDEQGHPFTTFAGFWTQCMNMAIEPEAPLLPPKRITKWQGISLLRC